MWRAHPRKSWTDRSWKSASGNGRTAVFSVSMKLTPPSKNTCRLWRPDAMPTFHFSVQKSFPYPTYPPRRNGLDWHGLQRCGNHWGIFVFPPRRQKGATSIETCLVIRNTGDHEAYDFQHFCGGVAAILREGFEKLSSVESAENVIRLIRLQCIASDLMSLLISILNHGILECKVSVRRDRLSLDLVLWFRIYRCNRKRQ